MSVRIDPVHPDGSFNNITYNREDYTDLKDVVSRYIILEGFSEEPGEYLICLLNLYWLVYIK
jgi:hypothetical protein